MPYVVTQACCADASCVQACPVNCIHPAPGEPGFGDAEMVYVDPGGCVDCGACATACPVDAVVPHTKLTAEQLPFAKLNADYFDVFPHLDRAPLAVQAKQRRLRATGPFRVAVIGAGPAGLYAADDLLRHPEISVDVYDRLPTPYGLVRAGVAPDHPHTKRATELFEKIEQQPGFRYFLGVEVGTEVTLEELSAQYDAVIYAVGASSDRSLGIPGEDLPGSSSATDFVGWYNGHPDKQDLHFPLEHTRAVVIGNGNVALDVARILTADAAELATTDMARLPWAALMGGIVSEVVVLGRRGPEHAAFTLPELIGLAGVEGLNVRVESGDLDKLDQRNGRPLLVEPVERCAEPVEVTTSKMELLAELNARPERPGCPTIILRFHTSPTRIIGDDQVEGIEVISNDMTETIETGLVLRAIGYHGQPVADLPYDAATGTVPNQQGRVQPGLYVVGWIKRGPSGFIGTNKTCAQETVNQVLDDFDAGRTTTPLGSMKSIAEVVRGRQPHVVDLAGWQAIDAEERRRGAEAGRPRTKIVEIAEMRRIADQAAGRGPVRRYASPRLSVDPRS